MANVAREPGNVVNLLAARSRRLDFAGAAQLRFTAERQASGLSYKAFAELLTDALGWPVSPEAVSAWESASVPPGDVLLAAEQFSPSGDVPAGVDLGSLLDSVPHNVSAATLAGPWVTAYQFLQHGETPRCHVDIAHVTALSERRVRAVNYPPEPRSEGRANPFRNEIEAQLAGRHLVGTWKNTSDTRYFGAIQLAVLPSETTMEGYFTGVGSDVHVSTGHWKWVRLNPGSAANGSLADVALRDPTKLYDLVMNRSPYDPPLTLTDIAEDR